MPRLPIAQGNGRLTLGRTPRGVQPVPVVGQPAPSQQVGQLLGTSIAQFGEQLAQGQQLGRQQQHAQDILDSAQQAQEFELQMATTYADLVQGDHRVLPAETVRVGRETIATMRQGLNRDAGQRFETHALNYLNTLHVKALGEQSARREAQKHFVMQQEVDRHTRGLSEATDVAEITYRQTAFREFLDSLVTSGQLRDGRVAAQLYQKVLDDASLQRTRAQIRLYPHAAMVSLAARMDAGETMQAGTPLATLYDEARQQYQTVLREQDYLEKEAAEALGKAQTENEVRLTNEVWSAPNVSALIALREATQAAAVATDDTGVSDVGQRRLFSVIHARIADLQQPAALKSDPATLQRYGLEILAERGNRSREQAQHLLDGMVAAIQRGDLRLDTDTKGLLNALQDELQDDAPANLTEVKQVRSNLYRALQVTSPFEKFNSTAERNRQVAMRYFEDTLQAWVDEGVSRNEIIRRAGPLAREIEDTHASETMRTVWNELRVPPKELPPGILDETGFPVEPAQLNDRYARAVQEIIRQLQTGAIKDKNTASYYLGLLKQRKKYWEYLYTQQPPPAATAPVTKRWWQRIFPPTEPEPGEFQRR